jgi:hypothetical protein
VITPQTIVVDQDKVFVSSSFVAACGSLGISLQPAPPGNGPAKGHVERTFSSINTLFTQHVASYTGPNATERGRDVEGEAVCTVPQLSELLQEWIICGWQMREHDGLRHPMMPKAAVSPNEMWAALVAVCGHVPVPLRREDYIELMPVKRQKINDHGAGRARPGVDPGGRRARMPAAPLVRKCVSRTLVDQWSDRTLCCAFAWVRAIRRPIRRSFFPGP